MVTMMVNKSKLNQVFKEQPRVLILSLWFVFLFAITPISAQNISVFTDETPRVNNQIHGSWYLMGTSALAWLGASYFQHQVEFNREEAKRVHTQYLNAKDNFSQYKDRYYQLDNRRKGSEFGRNLTIGLAVLSTLTFAVAITF